jgi:hypothetical protein
MGKNSDSSSLTMLGLNDEWPPLKRSTRMPISNDAEFYHSLWQQKEQFSISNFISMGPDPNLHINAYPFK